MSAGFKLGMFTAAAGTVPFDQSVSSVGFQPKAIIFFTAGFLSSDSSPGVDEAIGVGFVDATQQQSYSWWTDSNVATTSCVFEWRPKAIINSLSATNPIWYDADLKSFDTDGFTITWTTDAGFREGREIYYIALGGTDITNVTLHKPTIQSGTGNKNYTGVGFQPDVIFILSQGIVSGTSGGGSGDISAGFGCGISSTRRWATAHCMQNGQTMSNNVNAQSYQRTDSVLLDVNPSTGSERSRFDLVSLDSDGYTLNQIVNGFTAGNNNFVALCIKGGSWDVGSTLAPSATGDTSVTSMSFQPTGVIFLSDSTTASTSVQSASMFMIGAGDASTSRVIHAQAADSVNTSTVRYFDGTKAIELQNASSKAVVSSLNSNGFTLTWNPMLSGQANFQVLWVATALQSGTTGPSGLKTIESLAKANVKTLEGLAMGSIKTWEGLT